MPSGLLSIIEEDKGAAPSSTSLLGIRGETLAAEFLKANGYRLVMSNFRVPIGRNSKGVQVTGEIDIVGLEGSTLCFVEVKTRRSDEFTPVITNIDLRKQRQIIRTSKVYRRIFNIYDVPHRFDAVTVLMPKHSQPTIELVRDLWNEDKFRKSSWVPGYWNDFY